MVEVWSFQISIREIDSKSTTNNDRLPKTRTVSEVFMSLVAGIMFTLGAFLGLKKKDQD